MEREYQKPEVEVVVLVTEEITSNDHFGAEPGVGSNIYFD